jgi:hypothetical protein
MKTIALLVSGLSAATALLGLVLVWVNFVPVPFDDLLDMTGHIIASGGWRSYGIGPLLQHHNEHRLILTQLAILLDLTFFDGRQTLLISLILSSALVNAALLTAVAWGMGFSRWTLLAFGAMAFAVALSPVQHENFLSGFQVQFIQVWTFAILAFGVLSLTPVARDGRNWAFRALAVIVAIQAGLLSTYSMKNGLIVWPMLVILAFWLQLGWRIGLALGLVGALVIAGEVIGFGATVGHANPVASLTQPDLVARYMLRYLTSGIQHIGSLGRDLVGICAVLGVVALAAESLFRRDKFNPFSGVLLATGGFIIASAFVTALGRVDFGLAQANASRYATPSLIFLWVAAALFAYRLIEALRGTSLVASRVLPSLTGLVAVLILVPGLVSTIRNWDNFVLKRDAKLQVASLFLAGGAEPEMMRRAYPHTNQVPARAFGLLMRAHKGPFADTGALAPFVPEMGEVIARPEQQCAGVLDEVRADTRQGLRVYGWMAWPDTEALDAGQVIPGVDQPAMTIVTDEADRVIGWGRSLGVAEPELWKQIAGSSTRRFVAVGPLIDTQPDLLRVLGVSADRTRTCLLSERKPPEPRFVSELPSAAEPVGRGGWRASMGKMDDDFADPIRIVSALDGGLEVSWSDIPVRPERVFALPIRTDGAYPNGMTIDLIAGSTGSVVASLPIHMTQNTKMLWALFPEVLDLPEGTDVLTVRVKMPHQPFSVGLDLGRPAWTTSDSL